MNDMTVGISETDDFEQDISEEILKGSDVAYEEELKRNSFSTKIWWSYLETKKDPSELQVKFSIYERAFKFLPRSYKLWWNYLRELSAEVSQHAITSERYIFINNAFETAIVHLPKMPRIWIDFCEFLWKQKLITRTRRTYDKALITIPLTQHKKIWDKYIEFVKASGVVETCITVFKRYLMLEPENREIFVAYLLSIGHYDEAAVRLADLVNDEDFVSIEGKPSHQMWVELCDLIARHPKEIKSLRIEPILRSGISRYSDQVGRFWCSLAEHFIILGQLQKARDIYEEALGSMNTVRDFGLVFDSYIYFAEGLASKRMEALSNQQGTNSESAIETDFLFDRLSNLLDRRGELLSSVKLRQNPHNVHEWINRAKLFSDNPSMVIRTYAEGVKSIDPFKAVGKLHVLWIKFARIYESNNDLTNCEAVFDKAVASRFKSVDDLASIWCEWVEVELRHHRYGKAIEVVRQAIHKPRSIVITDPDAMQNKLFKSVKLWCLCADIEEAFGTLETTTACYDKMFTLKVISPQLVLNYAKLLESRNYYEESFRVYERAIALFKWPHLEDIWMSYLSQFVSRYKGRKLERARELFQQVIVDVPAKYAMRFYFMYAQLEEEYGMVRRALDIYHKATQAVESCDMSQMYLLYIAKTMESFEVIKTREIYAEAIEKLSTDDSVRDMCQRYANMERSLGEIDRARVILEHASQFSDPRRNEDFWQRWREFEIAHGSEDTFRDMLRIKRSVQAQFSHAHFNLAETASALGITGDAA